jgi:hypothetical protein
MQPRLWSRVWRNAQKAAWPDIRGDSWSDPKKTAAIPQAHIVMELPGKAKQ